MYFRIYSVFRGPIILLHRYCNKIFPLILSMYEPKYSKMDQVKFVEDNLLKADHIPSNFLKTVFHKFYLVYSWILGIIFLSFCWQLKMFYWIIVTTTWIPPWFWILPFIFEMFHFPLPEKNLSQSSPRSHFTYVYIMLLLNNWYLIFTDYFLIHLKRAEWSKLLLIKSSSL